MAISTLEETINLLNVLPESQIEMIYSFVQFLSSQQTVEKPLGTESLDYIFGNIVGGGIRYGKDAGRIQRGKDSSVTDIFYIIRKETRDTSRAYAVMDNMLPVMTPAAWIEMIERTQKNH